MKKENIKERLKKLKVLAERGIGGEKETALQMYEELKNKYNFSDEEIINEPLNCEWFRYKDGLERRLLIQVCYMVTGSIQTWSRVNKKYKLVGCECTEFEKKEIEFYFGYYKEHLNNELDVFMTAFCSSNHLYPDENARCYETPKDDSNDEDKTDLKRAAFMSMGMESRTKPRNLLEVK